LVWHHVPAESILGFLASYQTHEAAYKVNNRTLMDFIERMSRQGELTDWTVAVMGGRTSTDVTFGSFHVKAVERQPDMRAANQEQEGRYIIRRLLSPRDESIDLDEKAYSAALEYTRRAAAQDPARGEGKRKPEEIEEPRGQAIRHVRGLGSEEYGVPPILRKDFY